MFGGGGMGDCLDIFWMYFGFLVRFRFESEREATFLWSGILGVFLPLERLISP